MKEPTQNNGANASEHTQSAENNKNTRKPKKALTLPWIISYVCIGAMFAMGFAMLARQYILLPDPTFEIPTPQALLTPTPTPAASPAQTPDSQPASSDATPTATPQQRSLEVPVMIYFDSQKQKCAIIPVGVEEGNIIGAPASADESGWFHYSAPPGDPGNSIISGHQAYRGKKGIFSVLKNIKPGDRITVEFASGFLRYFEVDSVDTYPEEDVPQDDRSTGGETRLTLITCLGDYGLDGYSKSRVIARCHELLELRQPGDTILGVEEIVPIEVPEADVAPTIAPELSVVDEIVLPPS